MFYIFAALLCYTAALLLGAYASRKADTNLVAGVTNVVGTIIPLATFWVLAAQKRIGESSREGIVAAIAGGVAIALFVMAINRAFTTDKVAIVSPVVFGGAIVLSTVLSWWIFKERLTPVQAAGLGLMTIGIVLVVYAKATGR